MSRNFDAVDDLIAVTANSAISNIWATGGTVSFHTFRNGDGESASLGGLIVAKEGTNGWIIRHLNDGSTFINCINFFHFTNGVNGSWVTQNSTFGTSSWIHFAIVFNKSSVTNDPVIYQNGVSATLFEVSTPSGTFTDDSANNLNIGNRGDTARTYNGLISNVQLFNRGLNNNEVKQIMFLPGSIRNGLVGYWPLWGGSPEADYSGNNNSGTISGGAILSSNNPPINGIFQVPRPELLSAF